MKTTIDLPDTLVRQARQRALHEGRPFKDLVAEFIRQGLSQVGAKPAIRPGSPLELGANGLPVFRRDPAVAPRIPSLQELWSSSTPPWRRRTSSVPASLVDTNVWLALWMLQPAA